MSNICYSSRYQGLLIIIFCCKFYITVLSDIPCVFLLRESLSCSSSAMMHYHYTGAGCSWNWGIIWVIYSFNGPVSQGKDLHKHTSSAIVLAFFPLHPCLKGFQSISWKPSIKNNPLKVSDLCSSQILSQGRSGLWHGEDS